MTDDESAVYGVWVRVPSGEAHADAIGDAIEDAGYGVRRVTRIDCPPFGDFKTGGGT